jgi:hypothetical protein
MSTTISVEKQKVILSTSNHPLREQLETIINRIKTVLINKECSTPSNDFIYEYIEYSYPACIDLSDNDLFYDISEFSLK